jgi:cytochrome P450
LSAALTIDFTDPAVIADPYPALHALQDSEPAHWNSGLRSWCLTRYDDVAGALRDPRFSSDRIRPFVDGQHRVDTESIAMMGRTLSLWAVFTDPPLHTRLRGLLNKGFSPGAIDALAADIATIVHGLVDGLSGRGDADLVAEIAWPLPATVIADILGVPRADLPLLKRWSDDIAEFVLVARANPEKYAVAAASLDEMCRYFTGLIAALRRHPGRRVIDALIAARDADHDDSLSPEELVASCALLLFAGHETTTHFIANSVWALLHHRECWDWLRERRRDPLLLGTALNELLRWDGPSIAQARVLADDVVLHDAELRAGQRVYVFLNAANRDPRQFADPDRLDLTRADARRHLTFGHGLHTCLGAHLARLEGAVALPILLERLAEPALVREQPDWTDSLVIRGMKSLPLRYTLH